MVKDSTRPVPILLVPKMGKNIQDETEFSKRTYGKGVMFYPGELDTLPFSVKQLPCGAN